MLIKLNKFYNNITMSREDKISQIKEMVLEGDLSDEKGKEFEAEDNIDMETMKTDFKGLYDKAEKVLKNSTELTDGKVVLSLDGGTEDFENYPERFEEIGKTLEELRGIMKVYRTEKVTTKKSSSTRTRYSKKDWSNISRFTKRYRRGNKEQAKKRLTKRF